MNEITEALTVAPNELLEIRKVAATYTRLFMPTYSVNGVASSLINGNIAFVSVDVSPTKRSKRAVQEMSDDELKQEFARVLTRDSKEHLIRRIVNMLVRRFYREDGSAYWLAQPLTPELSAVVGYKANALDLDHINVDKISEEQK